MYKNPFKVLRETVLKTEVIVKRKLQVKGRERSIRDDTVVLVIMVYENILK
jgi:hypothetical protein